jgi:hypothetical protein
VRDAVAIATTTIAVLRGTTTDAYGDEADVDTDTRYTASRRADGAVPPGHHPRRPDAAHRPLRRRPRAAGTDVTDQDRIKDERTGAIYIVDAVSSMANPAVTADLRLDLRRTT